MLPKQRYKQEQRLMLLNVDSIVDTYQHKQAVNSTKNVKRNCSSQSTEEGFFDEFTSFSEEDDELLILQKTGQIDRVKPPLTTKTQVFLLFFLFILIVCFSYI